MKKLIPTLCLLLLALMTTACSPRSCLLEPTLGYTPQVCHITTLPSAFPDLTPEERCSDWGKELLVGEKLACELDLYRAITAFKRAHILFAGEDNLEREQQIEYGIFFSYYLGGRYQDALNNFECGTLTDVNAQFPAIRELLIAVYDSYMHTEQYPKAFRILELIDACDTEIGVRLRTADSLVLGDLVAAKCLASDLPCEEVNLIEGFAQEYCCKKLSVRKAQTLNAILPGAGYYYVGQEKAAATSLIINTLFTAAAYTFFEKGNWAAGLITTSLELGWYIGGINGAGLAAKEYNECIYNTLGKEMMIKGRLFPVLLFQTAF
ncbi:MAG: tetratricopeptide repeat protein [Parachlamydiales bacterium]|jgi:hypothetical protein